MRGATYGDIALREDTRSHGHNHNDQQGEHPPHHLTSVVLCDEKFFCGVLEFVVVGSNPSEGKVFFK